MRTLVLATGLLLSLAGAADPGAATVRTDSDGPEGPQIAVGPVTGRIQHGGPSHALAKADTDTFWIYGGPGTEEGKFQTGPSGLIPDDDGWLGVDRTDQPVYWQLSTFNAANLNGNAAGNVAAWSGRSAAQAPGWAAAPGYGNSWFDGLIFEAQVADPAQGQVVGLDFYFNHDTEPGYDFFEVYYDSAGTWLRVLGMDGSSADASGIFVPPGGQFATQSPEPIVYVGNDYGGSSGDQVRIRLVVSSDGAWSDEDGLFPTSGGAAQVDDITVSTADGVSFTDFELGFGDWRLDKTQFVGDFSAVYPSFDDLDPCRSNRTPVVAFVDRGQELCAEDCLPGSPSSTGGTTSPNWNYGFAGGWVVNYNGGLTFGASSLDNQIWSPEIAWDLPGTADDDAGAVGLILSFDVWEHLPLLNGMFHRWEIRSSAAATGDNWSGWQSRNFVYYGAETRWVNFTRDVTDLAVQGASRVQISIGVMDLALIFGFPGADGTPSPVFDNVGLRRFTIGGPLLTTRTIDLANDGFPIVGSIDASSLALRDQLDIPFDMARDVSTGTANTPGDSVTVDVVSRIPGATVTDIRMKWVLDKNSLFEDAIRSAPSGLRDENVDASDPLRWFGEVVADTTMTTAGAVIRDRFFFDLPDVDFLYPGDRLRYYVQATDSDARVSTLPADITGFESGGGWNRAYQVYGLPSIVDASGVQPTKLLVNDFGRRGGENDFLLAMGQLGFVEGSDYDTYTVQGPSSTVSNGIGSAGAHGANADQLAGYDTIVYMAGDLSSAVLSDGQDQWGDKGDDIGVLTTWHDLPGDRHAAWFGDALVSATVDVGAAGGVFVQNVLGVSLNDTDVRDEIEGQTAPVVLPQIPAFSQSFVAYGGCLTINRFDSIEPLVPAVRGHGFEALGNPGVAYANLAASVVFDRVNGSDDRRVDVTFPFGLVFVQDRNDQFTGDPRSARTLLLRDLFDLFGVANGGNDVVAAPVVRQAELTVFPSPFNPRTTISLVAPRAGALRVEIFDLRGRRVRTLFRGEIDGAGELSWVWQGRDDAGASVASGVYVVRAAGPGFEQKTKVALVR